MLCFEMMAYFGVMADFRRMAWLGMLCFRMIAYFRTSVLQLGI